MKAYIFLYGKGSKTEVYRTHHDLTRIPGDTVICANGGYRTARSVSIEPQIVVGDLDSLQDGEIGGGIEIRRYPPEKDYSDFELALTEARRLAADEVFVYGALGGRKDHEIINLAVTAHAGLPITLIEETVEIHNVVKTLEITGKKGRVCSLVAFFKGCRVGHMEGFRYTLENEELRPSSRGLSNVIECNRALISIARGSLFVIIPAAGNL